VSTLPTSDAATNALGVLGYGALKGIAHNGPARALAVAATLALAFACDGSQQGFREGADIPSEPPATSVSAPPPTPSTKQTPPRGEDSPEEHEGLEVGEPAGFENGLVVTVEGASLVQAPSVLEERLEPDDLLVTVRFSAENANPEGRGPLRTFKVTTALWQARDQNGTPLETLYPLETSLVAGELPNPDADYPYLDWQGELRPGQVRQGSVLFVARPATRMRVRFTQPVMNPPIAEWELGRASGLPRAF
jgi:hypothetical protein